jgi:NADH-quinone oxidoreductase subunit G
MATVDTSTVTLSINDREITVPKGLSLVEAAAEAGIEVPVFCYEPRIGPAVGACRMCLVEIEGMPKLQTACTTPAADGMVVHSASDRAREGQDAVLEFLLINHPLDCPVCDKGGECPLQDLTFRYGPSVTRMTVPKRTHDKPVPISPLIKLDRERCILCYRCTRFSENVSEDLQLVTENRGSHSVITTFEGRPYDGEFSGNVTELCPVGALTSATYRFRGRPWETQHVPTVCGHCPVGCNTAATIREGKVVRVLSRNHPEVDEGWLCDRGRYAFTSLWSDERITGALIRGGRGLEPVAEQVALDHVADRLRATIEKFGPGSVAILASGEQTNEEAHVWARLQREVLGDGPSVAGPEGGAGWEALEPYAARIADIDDAEAVVVVGDVEPVHRVPVIELRIRRALQRGARLITVGAGGTRLELAQGAQHISMAPGTAHTALLDAADGRGELATALGDRRAVIVWTGRMSEPVSAVLAHAAHALGASVLRTPAAANELGCLAAGLGGTTPEEALRLAEEGTVKAIVLLGADPVGTWPGGERWRAALGRCFFALQVTMFQDSSTGWVTTTVPAAATLEKDGTVTNLEGRVQRLRASATPPDGVVDGHTWVAELAHRLGLDEPESLPNVETTEQAELPAERPARPAEAPTAPQAAPATPVDGIVVVGYRQLMSGGDVEHAEQLHFQQRRSIELAHDDAQSLGVATGDRVTATWKGGTATGPALVNRRLRSGVVRLATAVPHVGPGSVAAADPEEPAGA